MRFNQDALISDVPNDVRVTTKAGIPILISPSRYAYDDQTFTLTIDVRGLIVPDGEFILKLRADAVASALDRAVTLASGAAFPFIDG